MLKDKQFIRVDNEEEYEKLYEMCKLEFGFNGNYVLVKCYPLILEVNDMVKSSINNDYVDYDSYFFQADTNDSYINKILNSKYCIPFSSLNNYVLKTELLDKVYNIHQESNIYDICIFSEDVYLIKTITNYFIIEYNYMLLGDTSEFDELCADGTVGLFLYRNEKEELDILNTKGVLSLCQDFKTEGHSTHCIDADYFINKDVIYDKINKHLYKDGKITSRKIDVVNFLSEVIYEEAKIKQ